MISRLMLNLRDPSITVTTTTFPPLSHASMFATPARDTGDVSAGQASMSMALPWSYTVCSWSLVCAITVVGCMVLSLVLGVLGELAQAFEVIRSCDTLAIIFSHKLFCTQLVQLNHSTCPMLFPVECCLISLGQKRDCSNRSDGLASSIRQKIWYKNNLTPLPQSFRFGEAINILSIWVGTFRPIICISVKWVGEVKYCIGLVGTNSWNQGTDHRCQNNYHNNTTLLRGKVFWFGGRLAGVREEKAFSKHSEPTTPCQVGFWNSERTDESLPDRFHMSPMRILSFDCANGKERDAN